MWVQWDFDLDPLLDGPRARLTYIIEWPKLTYHIKTKQELTRWDSVKAHLRKPRCPIKDSLHGGPSRVLSPPADHPTAYRKFVMDKHMKVENTQKRFINGFPSFQTPYFSED